MKNPVDQFFDAVRHSLAQPQPAPALDRRSIPIYALLAAALVVELAVLGLSDFELGRSRIVRTFFWLFGLLALAFYLRRRHLRHIASLLEALAIPGIAAGLAVTGTVYLAAISGPFVDHALDAADHLLGFDFEAVLAFYRRNPAVADTSRYVYASFAIQAALAPSLLALSRRSDRLWIFLTAWCFALATVVLIFPFAPAAGPYVQHGVQEDVFDNFKQLFPWETGPAIEALRNGSMRNIGEAARGFVSIPSFHTAAGVFFAWAAWPWRWLRWPVLALNVMMIASTVVSGSHYLVDLIAGVLLAGMVLKLAARSVTCLSPPQGG